MIRKRYTKARQSGTSSSVHRYCLLFACLLTGSALTGLVLGWGETEHGQVPAARAADPADDGSMKVNVGGWIDTPHISPDGSELYFQYAPIDIWKFVTKGEAKRGGPDRPGQTTSGDSYKSLVNADIYVARRQADASWKVEPVSAVNTADNQEGCVYISFDGKRLYFARNAIAARAKIKTFVSERAAGGWGAPRPIDLPVRRMCNFHLSADEKEFFVDDDPTDPDPGTGKVIRRATSKGKGAWGDPKILPSRVNSSKLRQEQPWLSKDGRRLYFHRFRENGSGSRFMVALRKNDKSPFTKVKKLDLGGFPVVREVGAPVFAEPSLTADEKYLYAFAFNEDAKAQIMYSVRNSDGSWGPMQPVD